MLIELVDDLRCPRQHEETWLVASADHTDNRDIIDGTLGCPICHAEYPIREGVVRFGDPKVTGVAQDDDGRRIDHDLAMRLAAFLDLTDGQGFALLAGSWGPAAPLLRQVTPARFVVLNPNPAVAAVHGISVLEIAAGIPLADATCRGVALDESHADEVHLEAAVRVLRPVGRLVAPASTPTPTGVVELARDAQLWVAERRPAPPRLVGIRQRRR